MIVLLRGLNKPHYFSHYLYSDIVQGTTVMLPANASDPASMMAQALSIYKNLLGDRSKGISGNSQLEKNVENEDSIEENEDKSKVVPRVQVGEPVFSLQSPKKQED